MVSFGQHLEIYSGIQTTITWTWYQTPEEFSRINVLRYLVRTYSLALGRASSCCVDLQREYVVGSSRSSSVMTTAATAGDRVFCLHFQHFRMKLDLLSVLILWVRAKTATRELRLLQFCIFIVAVSANWHGFLITASPVIPAIHQPFVAVFSFSTIIIIF